MDNIQMFAFLFTGDLYYDFKPILCEIIITDAFNSVISSCTDMYLFECFFYTF